MPAMAHTVIEPAREYQMITLICKLDAHRLVMTRQGIMKNCTGNAHLLVDALNLSLSFLSNSSVVICEEVACTDNTCKSIVSIPSILSP
jgi:hypothetical protein